MNAKKIIADLKLQPHVEGGYFRRTFEARNQPRLNTDNHLRFCMTSIFYLLDRDSPTGFLHRNKSDIVHYFHSGDAIEYVLISPEGVLERAWLGGLLQQQSQQQSQQQLQLVVPGGWWKASQLKEDGEHGYGLLSEAVAPGFEYDDMELGDRSELLEQFPQHRDIIARYTRL